MSERYSRQTRFEPLGQEGQDRIRGSRVLLVGVGALGSHLASCLVRAGVGELWLVDRDVVELDNLPRQLLFSELDALHGRPKALAAAERLREVNGACRLRPVMEDFDVDVFQSLDARFDLILDGTDNFSTRYLINDLAIRHEITWIYGGAVGARGTAMAVIPGITPCLRCLLPTPPPAAEIGTCETEGILSPTIAMVAGFQSAQALKVLSGKPEDVARGVFTVDVWQDSYSVSMDDATPRADCPSCGTHELPSLREGRGEAVRLCGRNATQVRPEKGAALDLDRVASQLMPIAEEIQLTPHLLRFSVEGCHFSVFRGGRALLFGVDDPDRARILYDRYVGV